ncbi:ParB/RepB/Spo0J family partition protein [candidate division WOR-3 bacterium]|nr:ParB/RepB/Spo0J family partition protein [candidate division WOR-3 bacterium]
MGRQALGRGFDALIPQRDKDRIPLNKIFHSPLQPRMEINEKELKGLISSIRKNGVLQPVLVRKVDERYELVYGHRRFEAARRANLSEIPAVVRRLSDSEVLEIAVIENIQREDLNPLEEANAYYRLNTEFNLTQEEIAERVGMARSTITNKMRLLGLPDEVKEALLKGRITEGHARALLGLVDKDKILKEFAKIINDSKTVRQVEGIKKRKELPLKYQVLREKLIELLKTDVKIIHSKKKSKLVITFYSDSDLERLYKIVGGADEEIFN